MYRLLFSFEEQKTSKPTEIHIPLQSKLQSGLKVSIFQILVHRNIRKCLNQLNQNKSTLLHDVQTAGIESFQ